MAVFECKNCRFRFQGEAASKCPRCDSTEVAEYAARGHGRPPAAADAGKPGERPDQSHPPRVVREGKEGWMDFHNQQASGCPECGGSQFELNWKRKEKTGG